jgi:SAM-dependent methyltransferase
MGDHYGPAYHRMITRAGEGSAQRWAAHHDVVERLKTDGAILDIGCSSGSFLETFQGGAWKLSGVEISAPEAERARVRTQADVFVGDILDAPFQPRSFDVVTSFDVLEHLHRPREVMAKVFDWLKPNGLVYLGIPNVLSWEARLFRSYWYGLELPRHLYHFSPQSLKHLMASIGFSEEWVKTPPLTYSEYSARYVCDSVLQSLGFSRAPLAVPSSPGVPWRVVRKAWRLSGLYAWSHAAAYAGAGPAIEAVFRKLP